MVAGVATVMELTPSPAASASSSPAEFLQLPLAVAGARIMLGQLQRLKAHEAGARAGDDPEEVHKMRVATRRLRAARRVFGTAMGRVAGEHYLIQGNEDLRALARALGSVRDLDVFAAAIDQYAQKAPPADHVALERLRADKLRERAVARTALIEVLDGAVMTRLRDDLPTLLAAVAEHGGDTLSPQERKDQRVGRQGPRLIAKSQRALLRRGAVPLVAPSAELHRVRIAGKRLRYACEFFAPAFGRALDELVTATTELQDTLGTIHDSDVATESLLDDIQRSARDADRAGDAAVIARLIARYQAQRDEAAGQFRPQWMALPGPKELRRQLARVA